MKANITAVYIPTKELVAALHTCSYLSSYFFGLERLYEVECGFALPIPFWQRACN